MSVTEVRAQGKVSMTRLKTVILILLLVLVPSIALSQGSQRGSDFYCQQLNGDLRNAYTAAQAYLYDHPEGTINSVDILYDDGFEEHLAGAVIDVHSFSANGGFMTATHPLCNKEYLMDAAGNITVTGDANQLTSITNTKRAVMD